jgi:hypothetical protein
MKCCTEWSWVLFLFNAVIYVFLLLCLYILILCLYIFILPAGTLRLPWLRAFRAFSSVVRQMPGYNSQRRGTARTLPKLLCCSMLFVLCRYVCCLCVNVYCTTATGWQPNCSLTNISIRQYKYQLISEVWSLCEHHGHWEGESEGTKFYVYFEIQLSNSPPFFFGHSVHQMVRRWKIQTGTL